MVVRHGAVLGLAEIAKVIGAAGLNEVTAEIRDLPVSVYATHCPLPFLNAFALSDSSMRVCCGFCFVEGTQGKKTVHWTNWRRNENRLLSLDRKLGERRWRLVCLLVSRAGRRGVCARVS